MLQQLQQYLRDSASLGRTTTQVGPFLVTVNEAIDSPFLNYAVPDDGAQPTAQDVAALAAAMRARERMPRLEYLERTSPDTLAALKAAGFAVELRPPAMVCDAATDIAAPEGYSLVVPAREAERRALLSVQNAAFGGAPEVDAGQLSRSYAQEADGGIVLAVRAPDGRIAGGGMATPPGASGFTEVAGIAVAEGHRRRGLAAAITAELTRRALTAGVRTAYLTPGDDAAQRIYARAGFTPIGHMLHVRLE